GCPSRCFVWPGPLVFQVKLYSSLLVGALQFLPQPYRPIPSVAPILLQQRAVCNPNALLFAGSEPTLKVSLFANSFCVFSQHARPSLSCNESTASNSKTRLLGWAPRANSGRRVI